MKLVEEELDLGMDVPGRIPNRDRYLDLKSLHMHVLEYPASPVPRGTEELTGSRVISAKLAIASSR